jgi:Centromere DNA-binding protein complex CBF3 subunit, domain 2
MAAGPSPCYVISTLIRGGKTMTNGKVLYCGSVRNKRPVECSHGALGRYFIMRFTQNIEPFPDPRNVEQWLTTALWKGNNPRTNLDYQQHADILRRQYDKAGVIIKKVAHGPRSGAARMLDEHGVPIEVGTYGPNV